MAQIKIPWLNAEVQTLFTLVADEKVQNNLNGSVRNMGVFMDIPLIQEVLDTNPVVAVPPV